MENYEIEEILKGAGAQVIINEKNYILVDKKFWQTPQQHNVMMEILIESKEGKFNQRTEFELKAFITIVKPEAKDERPADNVKE